MKKQLHFSALLFTTLLLLFAFPQVGRGTTTFDIEIKFTNGYSESYSDGGPISAFNQLNGANLTGAKSITISNGPATGPLTDNEIDILKTKIQEAAATLTEVYISVDIDATDLSELFKNCTSLDSVTFYSKTESQNVDCTEAFMGCKALTKIKNFEYIKASSLKNAFNGCSKLEEIELGFASSGFKEDGLVGTFNRCSNLVFVDLSGAPNNINSLNNTFNGCKSLKYVYLPNINNNGVNLDYTFAGCNFNTPLIPQHFDLTLFISS